jgi:IMP dehydrogenase/GMP reductase
MKIFGESLKEVANHLLTLQIIKKEGNNYVYSIDFERSYGFEEIAIKQNKNKLKSRLDANLKSEFVRGLYLDIPMMAANMSTTTNAEFCIKLYKAGALGVMHRADEKDNILKEVKEISKECEVVAVSIGIGDDQFKFCSDLIKNGANVIFIDIAHGYSDFILDFGKRIKNTYKDIKLVMGNTTNVEMLKEASDFADAIKVGIAQGYACETKNTAGCTEKQFSAVLKFKEISKKYGIPIISDGGIREPADFTKAIAAGANSIMAGKIFAECPESAAEIVSINDVDKKLYAGMASEYVQNQWRGGVKEGTCTEGGIRYLDIGLPLDKLLERYSGALRSGIAYGGGTDIKSFQNNVEFIRIK